ncbi:MAG: molybdopterin-dependent oxidoreductase, partial [bacterium]|nr:molybdopterin-dependent oxidoreductase [bacterium]
TGMESADIRLESSYECRYIAHVPLEPRSALAIWRGDRLELRTGTQVPFGARRDLARAFDIPEDNVRVVTSDVGAGFGGKHRSECQIEAARLAKAAGKPVMLEWSREEEFTSSYCRPAGLVEIRSGVRNDGEVVAWDFHDYNGGSPSLRPPYDFANFYCGFHRASSALRQGAYRSLAAVINTFAREMHMEELAGRCGIEPLEFRLRNLKNPRMKAVLERVADRFGWGRSKGGSGRGFGFACNLEKDGHLALCLEL